MVEEGRVEEILVQEARKERFKDISNKEGNGRQNI